MLYESFSNFRSLKARNRDDIINLIAKDIVNFDDGSGHAYAPRHAFLNAAQTVRLHFTNDWFELYLETKGRPVSDPTTAPPTKVFALFIFMVYTNILGFVNVEAPMWAVVAAQGPLDVATAWADIMNTSDESQPKTPLRRVASHDSGYYSNKREERQLVVES